MERLAVARFPALDPSWLSRQEETKRAGLLLAALRVRAAMPGDLLAERLGVTNAAISYWENGQGMIDAGKLGAIAEALELTAEDAERLLLTRLPALEPGWLAGQEREKQAGLLLAAFRERAGLTQGELAEAVGVSTKTVLRWENGKTLVDAGWIGAAAKVLGLSSEEVQRFLFARWPALEPGWLAGQEREKQAGLLLAAFRERAGLTQGELAEAVGVNIKTVIWWESGKARVREQYADALVEHYRALSEAAAGQGSWFGGVEAERLKGICAMPLAATKLKTQ